MALTSFCKTTLISMYVEVELKLVWEMGSEKLLTVWPWKVLRGRSLPSRHTWMHMSVLQEANVVLFCQSTSSAGAVHKSILIRVARSQLSSSHFVSYSLSITVIYLDTWIRFTWVERELLFGFSCVCVPNDCRLEKLQLHFKTQAQLFCTNAHASSVVQWSINPSAVNVTDSVFICLTFLGKVLLHSIWLNVCCAIKKTN